MPFICLNHERKNKMIDQSIKKLVTYALEKKLIKEDDKIYCTNSLLAILGLDEYNEPEEEYKNVNLESTLKEILDFAFEKNLFPENSTVYRDLFDTKVMSVFVDRPSNVIKEFNTKYRTSPKKATDWFYKFSQDTDYIRAYRVKKDLKWKTATPYGDLDITINLSKPEKDPKAIAAAKLMKQSSYPKCQLCPSNEGYAGRLNHPARETIRIIPFELSGKKYFFQYSPYSYFNEHAIVFNSEHVPMAINHDCFEHLLGFVEKFPHYILGSNADLPIVGGSILTHDHYQGGSYILPMFKAPIEEEIVFTNYTDVKAGYVRWPLSDIRLSSRDPKRLIALADKILRVWRGYTDEQSFIYAETNGEPHNTITPIAHKVKDQYVLELVLRNNITTDQYPLGLYHPHQELWHIKKENIGLIEVMGLAVLPSRLNKELAKLEDELVNNIDPASDPLTEKHADWAKQIKEKYSDINSSNVKEIVERETGLVFARCLEDAGVYKQDEAGLEGFNRFVERVNKEPEIIK